MTSVTTGLKGKKSFRIVEIRFLKTRELPQTGIEKILKPNSLKMKSLAADVFHKSPYPLPVPHRYVAKTGGLGMSC